MTDKQVELATPTDNGAPYSPQVAVSSSYYGADGYNSSAPPPHNHGLAPIDSHRNGYAPRYRPSDSDDDSKRRSCCKSFWTAPFQGRLWILAFAFNILIAFCWGLAAGIWCSITLGLGLGFLVFFPFGPVLMFAWMLTWRVMGRLELRMQSYPGGSGYEYSSRPVFQGVLRDAVDQDIDVFSWDGFWTGFKGLFTSAETWKSCAYFIVLKLWLATATFCYSLTMLVVSLCFMFNWISVIACHDCYDDDWHSYEDLKWIVGSWEGTFITLPLGYVLLCITLRSSASLAHAFARISVACLGVPSDPRQNAPLMGGADAGHAVSYA